MQKKLFIIALPVFLFISQGYTQATASAEVARVNIPEIGLPGSVKASASSVSNRALKDFRKNYKIDADERWFTTRDGGFIVKYEKSGVECRTDYDRKGNWLSTTRYYTEKLLPKDIRSMVKSTYYDFRITAVQEITLNNYLVYIVHMEGEDTWMNLNICNGEMSVMEEFRKQ